MEEITIRDRIAFMFIRFGFRIALKNNICKKFYYVYYGDTYTFERGINRLMKTTEKGGEG